MSKFEVGQKVMLTIPATRGNAVETIVTKVGRALAYVAATDIAFTKEDGNERRTKQSTGYAAKILTLDEYAEHQKRIQIVGALSQAGIKFADLYGRNFTTAQLENILAAATTD